MHSQKLVLHRPVLHRPVLYIFKYYGYLEHAFTQSDCFERGHFDLARFPNGELHLSIAPAPVDRTAYVVGSIAPPEVNLFSFLILCHTLRKEGAHRVIAVIPYLAYARHDREEALKSRAAALIGTLLQASGVTQVLTCDLHSPIVEELFPLPLTSISPAKLFADEIGKLKLDALSIIAPDKGAQQRAQAVATAAGVQNLVFITKKRIEGGVIHLELQGELTKRAIVIDDILDTGQTLLSCCEELQKHGVDEIIIMVTHGLFTGVIWKRLFDLGVKTIYCTDSLPHGREILEDERITIVPIAPLILQTLMEAL